MNKSALPFISTPLDSNRNKSIISYDISESEASKSTTFDSLLPKKSIPKLELSVPIGPEPIKDFVPTQVKKVKEKKKEKIEQPSNTIAAKDLPLTSLSSTPERQLIQPTALTTDTISQVKKLVKVVPVKVKKFEPAHSYTRSLFESNLLQVHQIEPKVRNKEHNDWVTGILLLVVVIGCIINVSYRSRLKQLFNAFASNRFVHQMVREENVMFQRINIFLSMLFLLITSLFIFQIGRYYKLPFASNNDFVNYAVILFALFAFYFIKISTVNFLGFLLKIEREIKEYVFAVFLYNHFIGLGLIPVVVLLAFVPTIPQNIVFICAAACFLASFLLRAIRSYGNVSGTSRFSVFYLFLYLCALEILPLVVITKLIINIV
ncbi:MAG: DUF4271 domain-containing protein [Bacteroidia bacterium]|nr:DUF4271 domain-containing protein [Bacteroidota bacterium]MBP6414547.1 DUF4271 domain-containing protein [Bacteroidia bacterium]